jgi:hypothetical protein
MLEHLNIRPATWDEIKFALADIDQKFGDIDRPRWAGITPEQLLASSHALISGDVVELVLIKPTREVVYHDITPRPAKTGDRRVDMRAEAHISMTACNLARDHFDVTFSTHYRLRQPMTSESIAAGWAWAEKNTVDLWCGFFDYPSSGKEYRLAFRDPGDAERFRSYLSDE